MDVEHAIVVNEKNNLNQFNSSCREYTKETTMMLTMAWARKVGLVAAVNRFHYRLEHYFAVIALQAIKKRVRKRSPMSIISCNEFPGRFLERNLNFSTPHTTQLMIMLQETIDPLKNISLRQCLHKNVVCYHV